MTEQPFDTFREMMHLEPHGPDVFVGESWRYPWGRVYGGQVVAQALSAAAETVDPDYLPHSLHAYFIRGGTSDEPIRYEVDRIRNGRSFTTRRVVARQSNGAILNLSASFHDSRVPEKLCRRFLASCRFLHRPGRGHKTPQEEDDCAKDVN